MKNLYKLKNNIFKNIFIFSFSIILILFSLELFVRIVIDDGNRFEFEMTKYAKYLKVVDKQNSNIVDHVPNKTIRIMGTDVLTDSNGFRIKKNFENNLNKKKILMLGDSVTFGFGSKETFSDYLNNRYKEYTFLNTGVGNTNTIMQIDRFFHKLKKFKSEIIILNFFINDLENIKYNKKSWYHNFYLYNFIKYNSKIISIKFGLNKNNKKFYYDTFKEKNILNKTFKKISELDQYSKQENIFFFVNIIPDFRYLENYPFYNEENILINFLNTKNIKYIQGIDFLKNNESEKYWVSKNDAHPNENGHKLIADYLEKYLNKNFIF